MARSNLDLVIISAHAHRKIVCGVKEPQFHYVHTQTDSLTIGTRLLDDSLATDSLKHRKVWMVK
jgi:hypothetical protein